MKKNIKGDWVECALGELCKFSQGVQVPKNKQFKDNDKNRVRFLRIIDFTQGNEEPRYIEKPNEINIVSKEDISMVRYGTVGFVCTGMHGAIANNLFRIIPQVEIEKKYLISFLDSGKFKNQIVAKGATMQALNFGIIKPIKVPFPPLPIQRAIVAKIEELFSSLDSGIADLTKAQKQLVIYRQAVLKKAFEGHKEVQFEKIISSTQNGISKRKGEKGDLIKVLRLADIKNLKIDNTNPRKIQLNKDEENKYKLNAGDLIVIRVNGSINLVGRFIHVSKKDEIELWAFCDHFIRITLDLTKCHPIFYYYFFQLSKVRKFINYNMVSSAGQNTVSQTTVKSISVPLISLKEQHQIVREIESRLSVCDKVEESIAESLEKAKALRQSILKKAFEGKLLSKEEIAKCKQEKDYEPAHILLERIKAEKKKKK